MTIIGLEVFRPFYTSEKKLLEQFQFWLILEENTKENIIEAKQITHSDNSTITWYEKEHPDQEQIDNICKSIAAGSWMKDIKDR